MVRIANCSGFYGDRFGAAAEQLAGGPIDYLTGDYLAELTMAILGKARRRDPEAGYATTFLGQMEQVLGTALDKGVRIVANAGGLNPAGLAARLRELTARLGLTATIVHIEGDDLTGRLGTVDGRDVLTANVYLGSWAIVEALRQGADVVVCPRVTDAALTVGPAAFHHGWGRTDWDRLAGAVVAGHVIECGCQATGGNYPFLDEVRDPIDPGFPIVEIAENGEFVVTKHPGTGGLVSVGTVTSQLVYEIDSPRYLTPDVTARFDSVDLTQDGPDRVRVRGVRGEPPPPTAKVCVNVEGGYRNTITFPLVGLDIERKADLVERGLFARLDRDLFDAVHVDLVSGTGLRVTVQGRDPAAVGRSFTAAAVELGLASYPGFFLLDPPRAASAYTVTRSVLVAADTVEQVVVGPGGQRTTVPLAHPADPFTVDLTPPPPADPPGGPVVRAPLGTVFGARSGDKGGDANVGVWGRDADAYAWLAGHLTVERFTALLPGTRGLTVHRHELPRLFALNFVVRGLLGGGASANPALDPQAKSLGELLRAGTVELPAALLEGS
ncbi:exopolyphosphatase [Actinophytocola xinjiangensis]|uniref:Exopolyphosphatase n=1 Tax=Actinophytocola xinjiangensis TaxID=485602 RepID=A0A7Z1AV04_9PSEU|nr:acyclic terpene utilization AtuA family protein [Actinophytocola xinjiangensis]OLF06667.1 exopolyphosphatase [Actinophytocola xinjiangensis]